MNSPDVIEGEFVDRGSALVVRETPFAFPVISASEAKAAMQQYLEVCAAVLTPDDYQAFSQWDPNLKRKVSKKFKKKSAVKKLQTFWGVSVRVKDVQRDVMDDGHFGFRCIATATTRDGREVEATGACSTLEERFVPARKDGDDDAWYATKCRNARARAYHDVLSTAETRATNRAVMNCIGVGGGEVTADEISRDRDTSAPPPAAKPRAEGVPPIVLRARALGVIAADSNAVALRRYMGTQGVPWSQAAMSAHFDELDAKRAATPPEGQETPVTGILRGGPSDAQRKMIFGLCDQLDFEDSDRHTMTERIAGKPSLNDITRDDARKVIDYLNGLVLASQPPAETS